MHLENPMNDKFACDTCEGIDHLEFAYPQGVPTNGVYTCTQCQTGSWHGLTSQRQYNPKVDLVINRPNNLGLS